MASPPPPHAPPLDDAALYPVDVLRIGEVLGIALAKWHDASVRACSVRAMGARDSLFRRAYSRVRELAIEAKRCTLLY